MERPKWLTDRMFERVLALWPIGRPRLETELGIGSHRARDLLKYLYETLGSEHLGRGGKDPDAIKLLQHLTTVPRPVNDLADAVDRSPSTVRRWIEELQHEGHPVVEIDGKYALDLDTTPSEREHKLAAETALVRIGFVSDTHLGSRYQQLSYLRQCYEWFAEEGVTDVYHAGDLVDGVGVYRGQHAELFLHTYQEQVDYAIENYPSVEGVTTHIIGGNHDLAAIKMGGVDPVKAVASRRPDIHSLGAFSAWITIGNSLRLYLLHPDGGGSYAVSYRLQKIIESFEGGRKPHILVAGHWHQRTYVDARNVDAYMPGCFQYQTPYETRKALQPRLGALLLEIQLGDAVGEYTIRQTFRRYLVPIENDW